MGTEQAPEVKLLRKELESWRPFVDVLRADDRLIAEALFERCWQYAEAIESSKKTYLVEPLFLSILLAQEKSIRALESQVEALRLEVEAGEHKPRPL